MYDKIFVSVIIPAYNEEKRLPVFLQSFIPYFQNSKKTYELIIVDDGSTDGTYDTALSFRDKFEHFDVIKIPKNSGKGHAVKTGLFKAAGNVCVFLDADGSVAPDEIDKNIHFLTDGGFDIFAGSRVMRDDKTCVKARWHRVIAGMIFNFFVQSFLFKNIKDTQCGFKMFRKEVIKPLFSECHLKGFGFDIEVLYLAFKMGYKVKEGPVSWHHVDGSKVSLVKDPVIMFFNILQIRKRHTNNNR